jgi:hypothetical protein
VSIAPGDGFVEAAADIAADPRAGRCAGDGCDGHHRVVVIAGERHAETGAGDGAKELSGFFAGLAGGKR